MIDRVNMVFKKGSSHKFYYLYIVEDKLIASYGRVGTLGIQRIINISTNKKFLMEKMSDVRKEKLRKGYKLTGTDSVLSPELLSYNISVGEAGDKTSNSGDNQFQMKRMIKID